MFVFQLILIILLALLSFAVLYRIFLMVVYFVYRPIDRFDDYSPELKFAVIVPAHNEAGGISETLDNLQGMQYPTDLYDIVVIADNCNDNTAELVKGRGIRCMERHDPLKKGKGFALEYAFNSLLREEYDAFVVVDADSVAKKNFLKSMNGRLLSGQKVVQAECGVSNPDASPLTYLSFVGNTIENKLFSQAKSNIGLPVLLRGDGMCFSREILLNCKWDAYSASEDRMYTVKLIKQGVKAYFASETKVLAEQPETLQQAYTQRVRWAAGGMKIVKSNVLKLILEGLVKRDINIFDTGLSFLVLSKPLLLLLSSLLITGSLLYLLADSEGGIFYAGWAFSLLGVQIAYITAGILVGQLNRKRVGYLLYSPVFVMWSFAVIVLGLIGHKKDIWERTERKWEIK